MMRKFTFMALLISPLSFAFPPEPICPSNEAIQSAVIQSIEQNEGVFVGVIRDKFNTKNDWILKVAASRDLDKDNAGQELQSALTRLEFEIGPSPLYLYGGWGCSYRAKDRSYHALVITPA